MSGGFDLAIVGSGFGGSLLAMIARRLGLSVILLERGRHPRFAIGESTSPLANLLIEELAGKYDLPRLLPLTTYGSWQRAYPEVVCGLKRGFTYFHHNAGQRFSNRADRSDQLLVAASPHDEVSDMHWLRSDVDHFLLREAAALGAEYVDEVALSEAEESGAGWTLLGERKGQAFSAQARFLVDASGPRGFLSRALGLKELGFGGFPGTQTLFSHFTGVKRCDEMADFCSNAEPPYPVDDAALHHVFDGGWMWVLRFNNGVTSAGISVTDELAEDLHLSEGEGAWPRFLSRFPSLSEQFAESEAIRPFVFSPRLSYRCETAAGAGWALLPSAAAFVDPLFSTGIPLTLLGIERLAAILAGLWNAPSLKGYLQEYSRVTLQEADWTARFVGGCFAAMDDFRYFAEFSMFYFAAASFSEMARRLDRQKMVQRFLAADHPVYSPALKDVAEMLPSGRRQPLDAVSRRVREGIEPLNIAGLCDPGRRNWYPVDLEDAVRGAARLGYDAEELRRILGQAPWANIPITA